VRHGCFQCHSLDGARLLGPTWRDLYESEVLLDDGTHVRADEAYLTRSMMDPLADRVAGFAPVMPSFQGQLTPPETAAIVELIKSLREAPGPCS
jgi:cytochrome c oxidase subunit 2